MGRGIDQVLLNKSLNFFFNKGISHFKTFYESVFKWFPNKSHTVIIPDTFKTGLGTFKVMDHSPHYCQLSIGKPRIKVFDLCNNAVIPGAPYQSRINIKTAQGAGLENILEEQSNFTVSATKIIQCSLLERGRNHGLKNLDLFSDL